MQKQIITPILFFLSILVFNLLFWQEQLGINVLLFTGMLSLLFRVLYPESFYSRTVQLTMAGSWLAAILVVWHHSMISQITYLLSVLVMTGMVHRPQLRFIAYGLVLGLLSILEVPLNWFRRWQASNIQLKSPIRRTFYVARITVLPLLFVCFFYLLYIQASEHFAEISMQCWTWLRSWFQWQISAEQVGFICLSLLLMGGVIWRSHNNKIPSFESPHKEQLRRKKNQSGFRPYFNLPDLRKEYRMALLSMFALNGLLLLFNIIDLKYVWLSKAPETSSQLRAYVHEGTYVLILSILLAMGLILFFFRKNLNFYPHNHLLKTLAYVWVVQNAMLVLSVAVRNFRYIESFGLAYKRIGVVLFLLLVLYGLWSILQKIRDRKHSYFLFHHNAWALYWTLLLVSTINWDVLITLYNLNHFNKNPVDARFLVQDVSDKNLFVLLEQEEQFLQRESYPDVSMEFRQRWLDRKKQRILQKAGKYSWLSWNYADHRNRVYLQNVLTGQ